MPTYHQTEQEACLLALRDVQAALPAFAGAFFRSLADYTSVRTRLGYARDLKIFFGYLSEDVFHGKPARDYTAADVATLTADHIEQFMEYLGYYIKPDGEKVLQNHAQGKSRKLAAVRGLFKFLYRKGQLPANPADLVGFPKLHQRTIVSLEVDEVARLLDTVEQGPQMTVQEKRFHDKTKTRDLALVTLLLGTGMRVSECVGLDLKDLDFDVYGAKVTRKGGDEMVLYFGDEVADALLAYLEQREGTEALPGHDQALFLSLQNRRITGRAVQNLVKKYAQRVTTLKNISPHKLRSTFATGLYRETGDIFLVANVLGHSDVNTTRKHYAKMDEEKRRQAANAVRLRK